jgi:hypothetical protein
MVISLECGSAFWASGRLVLADGEEDSVVAKQKWKFSQQNIPNNHRKRRKNLRVDGEASASDDTLSILCEDPEVDNQLEFFEF